jgi:hypothetical protein
MLDGPDVIDRLVTYIFNPLILLIFSFALLLFLWGLLEFLWKSANAKDHKEGTQHMIWGVIGMFIMVAAYGIITLITNTFGLTVPSIQQSGPSGSGQQQNVTLPSSYSR